MRSRWLAFGLCLVFGWAGLHRFYVGKVGSGFVYLFTLGFFGLGWFLDLFLILIGRFRDSTGHLLSTSRSEMLQWRLLMGIRKLEQMKSLDPLEFEHYVSLVFERMGYRARTTKRSGDHGIDVRLCKRRQVEIVQCKLYNRPVVGEPIVRDLFGTMTHEGAARAYLVTTGTITRPAREWAACHPIILIDASTIEAWVYRATRPRPWTTLAVIIAVTIGMCFWLAVGCVVLLTVV